MANLNTDLLSPEQAIEATVAAYNSKGAIEKIAGITSSASDIDAVITNGNNINLGRLIGGECVLRQTGVILTIASYSRTDYIEVNADTLYKATTSISGSPSICGYDENKIFVESYVNTTGTASSGEKEFTTGGNVKYLILSCLTTYLPNFNLWGDIPWLSPLISKSITRQIEDAKIDTPVYHVSPTGSDSNLGTYTAPLKTVNKAIELTGSKECTILLRTGDYREPIDFGLINNSKITIATRGYDRVRILGSDLVKSITATTGYSNIFQASMLEVHSALYLGKRLFDMDTPSLPITRDSSFPHQNGRKHRLSYTPMIEIQDQGSLSLNLAFLDSLSGAGIWHDKANGIVYMKASDNGDLTSRNIEVPKRKTTNGLTQLKHNMHEIIIKNVEFYFSTGDGVCLNFFKTARVHSSKVLGASNNGWSDGSTDVSYIDCEAGDCGRDGFGGNYDDYIGALDTPSYKSGVATYSSIWTHDNGDDGLSHHKRGKAFIHNSLAEHNGYEGFSQVNGASIIYSNTKAIENGQFGFHAGHGGDDGRLSTNVEYMNCHAEGNLKGFRNDCSSTGSVVSKMTNCVSKNNTQSQYSNYTPTGSSSESLMTLVDCKGGGVLIKEESGDAVISIVTNTLVPS